MNHQRCESNITVWENIALNHASRLLYNAFPVWTGIRPCSVHNKVLFFPLSTIIKAEFMTALPTIFAIKQKKVTQSYVTVNYCLGGCYFNSLYLKIRRFLFLLLLHLLYHWKTFSACAIIKLQKIAWYLTGVKLHPCWRCENYQIMHRGILHSFQVSQAAKHDYGEKQQQQ